MAKAPTALVVGTGIGGLSAAIALRKIGWTPIIVEQADALRTSGSGLSVMSNAASAMKQLLDVDIDLRHYGAEIKTFEIRHQTGRLLRRLPMKDIADKQGAPSVCISRARLQQALLSQLDGVDIRFNKRAVAHKEFDDQVEFQFADGSSIATDIAIGADGFYSNVRELIGTKTDIQEAGYICWLALVKFRHPNITPGHIVHYWGSGRRFGIIDIGDGWVYWWGTANMPPAAAKAWRGTNDEIAQFYAGWPKIVSDIIGATDGASIISVDAKDRSFPGRWTKGRVTLLGDAAHPMLTSLGQGAGISIEDAAVLGYVLREDADPAAALRRYEAVRQPRARAIVEASRSLSEVEQYDTRIPRFKRDWGMWLARNGTIRQRLEASLLFDHHAVVAP